MQSGELFAGRYRVERTLGRGGMGVVYLARDERLHRLDALKVMNAQLSHDPTFRKRFEREAKAAARLEHPNVVQVRHYDEHEDTLYLVMQYVDGNNLQAEIQSLGRINPQRTAEIVRQVAEGLDAAHRAGHVHRDVKPANILLGRNDDGSDRVLLTDFGLAQPLSGSQARLTSVGDMLGTVAYAAPEQLRGEPAIVPSDVYALACVAYECLSGRPPFSGGSQVEIAGGHLHHVAPLLTVLIPGLSSPVAEAVATGLAKSPMDRPASAGAFARRLCQATGAAPISLAQTTTLASGQPGEQTEVLPAAGATGVGPARAAPRPQTRRAILIASTVVVMGFVVGLAAGYFNGGSAPGKVAASPTSTSAADPHVTLIRRLPITVYGGCVNDPASEGAERTAALSCGTPLPGADQLLVTQWRDTGAMDASSALSVGKRPDGRCGSYTGLPTTGLRSTWGQKARLSCYINSNGAAIVLWQYPESSVQVLSVRKDGDAQAAFAWWRKAVETPLV